MKTRANPSVEERLADLADEAVRAAGAALRTGREFLASEEGRELRHKVSGALIWAAPVIGEFPLIRRTVAGRVLRVAGVTAILVKGAEWLRDWEPSRDVLASEPRANTP